MDLGIDSLVQSFAKEARKAGVAVLVAYGFTEDGKPILRVTSNVDSARAQGMWNFLTRVDERGAEAAAKVLAFATRGERPLEALNEENPQPQEPDAYWVWISEAWRQEFLLKAKLVITAAKAHQGKTLNIITDDNKPLAV